MVEGLGEIEPTVSVEDVAEAASEDGTAVVTLGWSWPVSEQDWTYTSEATLRLSGEQWQVAWEPSVVEPSLRTGGTLSRKTVSADRADILGAGGQRLVTERPVTRFGIDKSAVSASRAVTSARRLAPLLDIDTAPYVEQVKAAGELAFVEGIVYRREDVPVRVGSSYEQIPGALAVQDTLALAPTREFAAPILGTVGEATAEMVEEDPERYQPGTEAGISGLQLRYDEQLAGTPGVQVLATASDDQQRVVFEEKPSKGSPLRLTLDARLQSTAERLLAPIGPASALVAIRPSSGEIVAAANGPGTDGYNMATYGQFAPGSTFKAVSSLALLRSGLTPESPTDCTATTVVDGKQFENYDDYPSDGLGRIPLRTAVANSCNTAFISERGRLGRGDLADAAASLGLGVDHDLGFPSYFGQVPPPASETEAAADLIGQGRVLASPMAMADRDRVGAVRHDRAALARRRPGGRAGGRPGPRVGRGRPAAGDAARGGDVGQRVRAGRRPRRPGDREDRHRRVRRRRLPAYPRLDDRRPGRHRRRGLRRDRRVGLEHSRPDPRGLPPRQLSRPPPRSSRAGRDTAHGGSGTTQRGRGSTWAATSSGIGS